MKCSRALKVRDIGEFGRFANIKCTRIEKSLHCEQYFIMDHGQFANIKCQRNVQNSNPRTFGAEKLLCYNTVCC